MERIKAIPLFQHRRIGWRALKARTASTSEQILSTSSTIKTQLCSNGERCLDLSVVPGSGQPSQSPHSRGSSSHGVKTLGSGACRQHAGQQIRQLVDGHFLGEHFDDAGRGGFAEGRRPQSPRPASDLFPRQRCGAPRRGVTRKDRLQVTGLGTLQPRAQALASAPYRSARRDLLQPTTAARCCAGWHKSRGVSFQALPIPQMRGFPAPPGRLGRPYLCTAFKHQPRTAP